MKILCLILNRILTIHSPNIFADEMDLSDPKWAGWLFNEKVAYTSYTCSP